VRQSLQENVAGMRHILAGLEGLGISMQSVTGELELEGVKSFVDAYTVLLKAVEERREAIAPHRS
jgi:transaldolase